MAIDDKALKKITESENFSEFADMVNTRVELAYKKKYLKKWYEKGKVEELIREYIKVAVEKSENSQKDDYFDNKNGYNDANVKAYINQIISNQGLDESSDKIPVYYLLVGIQDKGKGSWQDYWRPWRLYNKSIVVTEEESEWKRHEITDDELINGWVPKNYNHSWEVVVPVVRVVLVKDKILSEKDKFTLYSTDVKKTYSRSLGIGDATEIDSIKVLSFPATPRCFRYTLEVEPDSGSGERPQEKYFLFQDKPFEQISDNNYPPLNREG